MSTRSNIAVKNEDGTLSVIFCHWDGYPSHNGRILLRSYKTDAKVRHLIGLGSLSHLGDTLATRDGSNKDDLTGACAAHHRDFNYEWDECKPVIYRDENEWQGTPVCASTEWGYLYDGGKWFVVDFHVQTPNKKPLTWDYIRECVREEKAMAKASY